MDVQRILGLLAAAMAALGAALAAMGTLLSEWTTVGFGLVAAIAGVVLYWASDWVWDWLERLQSGEIEPTATLRAFLVVLCVAVWTGGFVGLWWLAEFGGVLTDEALAGNLISVVTVSGGVVPGVVLGGGLFAVFWVLRSRNASVEITKGSRVFPSIVATVLCTLGT